MQNTHRLVAPNPLPGLLEKAMGGKTTWNHENNAMMELEWNEAKTEIVALSAPKLRISRISNSNSNSNSGRKTPDEIAIRILDSRPAWVDVEPEREVPLELRFLYDPGERRLLFKTNEINTDFERI